MSVVPPELIAPGHPLLGSLIEAVDREFGDALGTGIVLEDDQENEHYALVTVVSGNEPAKVTAIETFVVRPDGSATPASAALYTNLDPRHAPGTADDIAFVNRAAEAVAELRPSAKVVAVASVRGTASPESAAAWRAARLQLRAELEAAGKAIVLEPLPGQGWDWATGDSELTFWSARPIRSHAARRRSERHVAANVGDAHYVVRSVDG